MMSVTKERFVRICGFCFCCCCCFFNTIRLSLP